MFETSVIKKDKLLKTKTEDSLIRRCHAVFLSFILIKESDAEWRRQNTGMSYLNRSHKTKRHQETHKANAADVRLSEFIASWSG